ncbi:GMC family oxidoreductase [Nonomuraea sp. NEAU-A123]|uniref:GMC family oxidoreductase n=1 Tax=Nonomuraea sp. NEAU-A123 TaxID=2839649 RepID=UPI001BE48C9B|nr:GMC family oxidoreductase [Nonomuraea sp. NEAU-A123]MBT2226854.1 GMC family oxidoreductase [Nonomuraea sp. NEAU-A123]
MRDDCDVLIVGAGPSGAVAAQEFARAGMRVICLEQGDWPDYSRARAGHADFELVSRKHWNWNPNERRAAGDYRVDDTESDISALMYNGVGGSTVMYAAQWERFLPSDFRVRTLDGVGDDWPISYWDLEPYYDEVERQFAVSGLGGNPALPPMTPPPLPPVPLNKVGRRGAEALNKLGWHWWPGTNAIATADYGPLHACTQLTACPFGCPTGSKGSADRTHWQALSKGQVRLVVRATVDQVLLDDRGRASGVTYLDENGARHAIHAGVVVLCANALGTPRILLNSADGAGIANSSGMVGRRLMMHPFGNAIGIFDEDLESWRGPLGQYLHSLEFYETDRSRGFVRGAKWNLIPSGAPLSMMLTGTWGDESVWGSSFTRLLRERLGHSVIWGVICEDLPDPDNRVTLDGELGEQDVPGVRIRYRTSDNTRAMMAWHLDRVSEVLDAMGAKQKILNPIMQGIGWHLIGTTVMGENPDGTVVDPYGECHDVPNLFVFDSSVFPTSSGVNPAATIAANALRCARALVARRRDVAVAS